MLVSTSLSEKMDEINDFYRFIKERDKVSCSQCVILKSNCLLMMYALVESVFLDVVNEIIQNINAKLICYNSITTLQHLKHFDGSILEKLNKIKDSKPQKAMEHLVNIIDDFVTTPTKAIKIAEKEQFWGNVDSNKIKKECGNLGIQVKKESKAVNNVKEKRNVLAHGNIRFSDIGSSITVVELGKLIKEVEAYLKHVITISDNFIINL